MTDQPTSNPGLVKTFEGAGILPYRLVQAGTGDYDVAMSNGAAPIYGASDSIGSHDDNRVDVEMEGVTFIEAGAAVSRGVYVISDAVGRVIAGNSGYIAGMTLSEATAAGDIIAVELLKFYAPAVA